MKIGYYDEYPPDVSAIKHVVENIGLLEAEVGKFEKIPQRIEGLDAFLVNMRANSQRNYDALGRLIVDNPQVPFFIFDVSGVHWSLFRKEYKNLLAIPENLESLMNILDVYCKRAR